MGHGSFAVGNAEGGLTTQEEKSMGAYSKSVTGANAKGRAYLYLGSASGLSAALRTFST